MIAQLRGRVVGHEQDRVVMDVGGVGYDVICHIRTIAAVTTDVSKEWTLHVHTSVSDDAIRLYGFRTIEELRFFRLLLTVERIGPKAALGMLGKTELSVMVQAIQRGDAALVATSPGIGRKTAERVVLELRDKLDGFGGGAVRPTHHPLEAESAVEGLIGLGFKEVEARTAVAAVSTDGEQNDGVDVVVLVGAALRYLDASKKVSR